MNNSDEQQKEPLEQQQQQLEDPFEDSSEDVQKKEEVSIKFGYVVGITDQNTLHFSVLGGQGGLVELLGLHRYAERKLDTSLDLKEELSLATVQEQVVELSKALNALLGLFSRAAQQQQSLQQIIVPR